MIAEFEGELVGFFVVGFFADGSYSDGCRLDAKAPIGRTMLPAYVAEIARRSHIIEPIADGEI